MNLFITGTGTDVGKTYVTKLLLEAATREQQTAVGFKPIACGDRLDAGVLLAASVPQPETLEAINPEFYKTPAAPMAAAMIENRAADITAIRAAYDALTAEYDHVLIEGAGGWEVPIRADYSMGDLAAELGAEVLIVVENKLGALNHTILTANAVRAKGLSIAGIVLNHVQDERDSASISNRTVLEEILNPPFILDLLHGETEIEWVC